MRKRRVTASLNKTSIDNARKAIIATKVRMLEQCVKFVEKLSERGISVAKEELDDGYAKYIAFSTVIEKATEDEVIGLMVATNTGLIHSEWMQKDGSVRSADVSPLLMSEFGAGTIAGKHPKAAELGMGTGTFPGQTHANDPNGWWYQTLDGEWHKSKGYQATMPVQKAADEMMKSISAVAREVFK